MVWESALLLSFLGQLASIVGTATSNSYDGYVVLSVAPATADHVVKIRNILQNPDYQVTLLESPLELGLCAKLMVASQTADYVRQLLVDSGTSLRGHVDDVNSLVDTGQLGAQKREARQFDLNDYNDYDTIMEELEVMVTHCPQDKGVICDLYNIGVTYEGRNLTVLRIRQFDRLSKVTQDDDTGKYGHWIDSLIHSRELLGGATNLKVMDHMTRNYESDSTVADLINSYDWYFLAVGNPDGYEFVWYGGDPQWQKNRRPNEGSDCIGTNLNRNFDFMWMSARHHDPWLYLENLPLEPEMGLHVGGSTDPCDNVFAGSFPASEVETQAVQGEADRMASKLLSWTSMHTAGRMWMHPRGYRDQDGSCTRAEDHDDMYEVATAAAEAVAATHNETWTWGTVCETIYPVAGITIDYAKERAGIKYAFSPELRSNRPPPEEIQLSFDEVWNGIVAMVHSIENLEALS